MRSKVAMGTSLLCAFLLFIGCSTVRYKIDYDELEAKRHKTFKVCMVKVVGATREATFKLKDRGISYIDDVEKKKAALRNIPIEDICNIISSSYGLNIDTDVDTTINTIREPIDAGFEEPEREEPDSKYTVYIRLIPCSENVYYGHEDCTKEGQWSFLFWSTESPIKDDIVNITYGSWQPADIMLMTSRQLIYKVVVRSEGKVLISYQGVVAHFKGGEAKNIWDNIVSCAEEIDEALLRDINAVQ